MQDVYLPLQELWPCLSIKENAQVLVPLCGKSPDLKWLTEQKCRVTGVEVSSQALREFMEHYPAEFTVDSSHGFTIYRSDYIELWEGDFLKLSAGSVATPDLIYDKASLVALPSEMREAYVQKILQCCDEDTQILLQTFEYNQDEMNGPPFSVDEKELRKRYGHRFKLHLLHEQSKFDELRKFQQRGLSTYLTEKVYYLESRIMG